VLFTTTLSKTVAAGLRIGFIWGKGPLIERLNAATYATSWTISPLMMEVAIQWIESGIARDRITWQRQETEARHRMAATIFPQLRGMPASPHIFIRTQAPARLFELGGVRVAPSSAFSRRTEADTGIRISLSTASSRSELAAALQECARIIEAHPVG
jgi:DNA-binding transcriptional MocR family regulator